MREIKFRVWTGKEMLYVKHGEEWQLNFGINDGWSLWGPYEELCTHKDGQLMQYTGFKDKNGQEIYEGDIVEHEMEVNGVWDTYEGTEIVYDSERAMFCFRYDGGNVLTDCYRNLEVIGNIYENPDF